MKIWEFVRELASFFPLSGTDETKNKIFDSYVENLEGIVLTNKCEYDWKKVLQAIQRTYIYSKFPPLADIIKCLPEGRIDKVYEPCENEGSLIVLTLPNGKKHYFTVCGMSKSLREIKEEILFKYGDYPKVEMYPKGTVVIGNDIVLP